jgi:hypothetical protein
VFFAVLFLLLREFGGVFDKLQGIAGVHPVFLYKPAENV